MTAPAILLLLNVYPLRRLGGSEGWWSPAARRVYLELVPFAALSGGDRGAVARRAPSAGPTRVRRQDRRVGLQPRRSTSGNRSCRFGLSPLYEMPQHIDATQPRFIASYVAVAALLVAAHCGAEARGPASPPRSRAFAIISLPMLGVVQNGPQIAADRYTYHAAPAFAMLAGALLLTRPRDHPGCAAAALVALGVLTWNQTQGLARLGAPLDARARARFDIRDRAQRDGDALLFSQDDVDEAMRA